MVNNCLKTQLKSVVDNDNLQYFGFIRIHYTPVEGYASGHVDMKFDRDTEVFVNNGANINNLGDRVTCTANVTRGIYVYSDVPCTLFVPKYRSMNLSFYDNLLAIQVDDLAYLNGDGEPSSIDAKKLIGNLSRVNNVQFTKFKSAQHDDSLEGDVSGLSVSEQISIFGPKVRGKWRASDSITSVRINGSNSYFDFDDFNDAHMQSYSGIGKGNIINLFNADLTQLSTNGNVYGNIESCAEKLWNSPISKRSGNVELYANSPNITFMGNNVVSCIIKYYNDRIEVTDRAGTLLGTYDGTDWT